MNPDDTDLPPQLTAEIHQIIQWHHRDRLTFEEIGQRLNRSAEAVRKLWARGIERLREERGRTHDS